jgi:GNAT superfamily N-acetyltransferase
MTQPAIQQTPSTSTYSIISYPASQLPKSYEALVYSKWLRSLRFGNDYFKLMDKHPYFVAYHAYLSQLLAKPNTVIRLAVLSDDPDTVLGFSVCRDHIVDYCHVHKDLRKQGIGTSLLPSDIIKNEGEGYSVTHLTNIGLSIWSKKLSKARFNPFA